MGAPKPGIALNDGDIVYRQACQLGCEGIVSTRLGSTYRQLRAPAVQGEAKEDWER